jgi:hypothetical protein
MQVGHLIETHPFDQSTDHKDHDQYGSRHPDNASWLSENSFRMFHIVAPYRERMKSEILSWMMKVKP